MNELIDAIAATALLTGTELTPTAARLLVEDLREYDEADVMRALARCRREMKGRLTLAAILERLDTGYPGAEEAWAKMPKSDYESAVITQEMANAWGVACGLYDDGDRVGARMAFKEAYEREVRDSKEAGRRVMWFLSAGYDEAGREAAAIEGIRSNRLSIDHALNYVEPEHHVRALHAAGVKSHPLLLESSQASEEGRKLLAGMVSELTAKKVNA